MAIIDITKPMALDETLQGTNTKMDAVIQKLQGIIDALGLDTSVYKPKGNITCAALIPALLIDDNLGNVYNVTDNGTTTSDFVEGAGKPIHVGDNVAIVDIGTGGQSEYKFDLLAGMVDLTNYVQKSATPGLLKNDGTVDTKDYAEKVAGATNGNLAGLNGSGNLTDSGWNGAKDTTSISGNPISISGLKANQLAVNPIITLEPIQAGSGTPSPSNNRAISGYDKIEVLSCGINVWNEKWELGELNASGQPVSSSTKIRSKDYISLLPNKSYYLVCPTVVFLCFYDENKNFISSATLSTGSFTTPANAKYGRFNCPQAYGTTYGNNISINYPATETSYVASNKTTDLSESLGQTVYGATWYPRTGVLLGDMIKATITSISGTKPNYYASVSVYPDTTRNLDIVCDKMETASSYGGSGVYINNNRAIMFVTSAYETAADLLAAFGGSVDVCYAVATPTEIQLTPHEISLLKDYAYVSTNGTNIALNYHNGELASLSDVSQLGETVENLEDYLARNESGTSINITSYNSTSNMFKIPGDGYIVATSETSTSGKVRAVIRGANYVNLAFIYMNVIDNYQIQSLFVRKGMYCYVQENSTTAGAVKFYPIK